MELSFRSFLELMSELPTDGTNADQGFDGKVSSKYSATGPKDLSMGKRGEKTPEQRFGFMRKKCRK